MKQKLGEDIIKLYEPYRNDKAKWRVSEINNQKFEIYDRYEIMDTSTQLFYVVGQGAYGLVVAAKDKEAPNQ